MYHPEYRKALELVRDLHKKYRTTISPSKKDIRLALYYLQGGCITQAIFSLKSWANGDLNAVMASKRFIDESKSLIHYLILVDDASRYVRRFFEDEIVTINPRKHKKDIMRRLEMDENTFETWVQNEEKLRHGFSKGVHPTYRGSAYNSDMDTGEFDYDAKNSAFGPMPGFDFANFIVIPTIDSVAMTSGAFGIEHKDITEIFDIRNKIQEMAIQYHKTRKGASLKI